MTAILTDEEVTDLARRVVTNEVFITNNPEAIQHSFSLILMGLAKEGGPGIPEDLGAIWEEWSKAGPLGINGHPFFTSAHFLHKDDLPRVADEIERMEKALGMKGVDAT